MEYSSGGNQWFNSTNHGGGGAPENCNTNVALRFRPIAPKPTPGGSNTSSITTNTVDGKRTKRRYSRVNRTSRSKRKSSSSSCNNSADPEKPNELITLQLLPSEPVRSSCSPSSSSINVPDDNNCRICSLNFSGEEEADLGMMRVGFAAEVWVTVECVTGVSTEAFPCTDELEVTATLSRDTCPAFLTNGCDNSVQWVNDALKEMVRADRVTVWLEVSDGVVLLGCGAAFTCKVRLRYGSGDGTDQRMMVTRTVPCDAWRVRSGGLAWRLDVRAGLTLGLD